MLHGSVFSSSVYRLVTIWFAFVLTTVVAGCGQQQKEAGIDADSSIQLIERSDEGAYRFRSITILSLERKVTVHTNQDEELNDFSLDIKEYEALWAFAKERKVETMEDAPLENAFPGQSQFEFIFRIGSDENRFTAYGVDYLTDTRYRELARRIIAIADSDEPVVEGPV